MESILSIPPEPGSINKYRLLGESSATLGFLVAVLAGEQFVPRINGKSMFEPSIPPNAQAASPDAGKK